MKSQKLAPVEKASERNSIFKRLKVYRIKEELTGKKVMIFLVDEEDPVTGMTVQQVYRGDARKDFPEVFQGAPTEFDVELPLVDFLTLAKSESSYLSLFRFEDLLVKTKTKTS